MDKTIVFKNGQTMSLSQGAINVLIQKIDEGHRGLVTFRDKEDDVVTVINIDEIVCVG